MLRALQLAAIAGFGTTAFGQVVFCNSHDGDADSAGPFSEPTQRLAGGFDLLVAVGIGGAAWRGTMYAQDPLDTGDTWSFDVDFRSADDVGPGEVIATRAVIAHVTETRQSIEGERVYVFNAEFEPVALAADTAYYFSVINTEAGQGGTFRWNLGTNTDYSAWYSVGQDESWHDLGDFGQSPLNFTLSVPTPSSIWLLGLASIAVTRRR